MSRAWEDRLIKWSDRPSQTEQDMCENAVRVISDAIGRSGALSHRNIKTFPQGSYRNRVNTGNSSDVDIGVVCTDTFFDVYPSGMSRKDFGNIDSDYNFSQYKNELENALVDRFGRGSVTRGNKAFTVNDNTYRLTADVVPLFEYREYWNRDQFRAGVALKTDNDFRIIKNYPERLFNYWPSTPLHYENGVSKNDITQKRFKAAVRTLKCLKNYMKEKKYLSIDTPGYLIECLAYNAPNNTFNNSSYYDRILEICFYFYSLLEGASYEALTEVDGIKYLFHPTQPWKQAEAREFMRTAIYILKETSPD